MATKDTHRVVRVFIEGILSILIFLSLVSCEGNPMKRLYDPYPDGALNAYSGVWKIYDEDLITGGNVAFIPSDVDPPNNNMLIDFKVTEENPPEGTRCLRFDWNGNDLYWKQYKKYEHDWAGATLIVATHWSRYDSTPSKDLSGGGYTKITFKAKAIIDSNTYVKFEGPLSTTISAPARGGTSYLRLTRDDLADWKTYTINLTPLSLKAVKDYFKIIIEYPLGQNSGRYGSGGTVFVDDVRYLR